MIQLASVFNFVSWTWLASKGWDWLRTNQQALAAMVAITGLVAFVWKIVPILKEKWRARWTRKHLPHTFGAHLYAPQEIDRATRYYVEPDCQSIDPSGSEEFRQVFASRESAFRALDHLLFRQSQYRHTLVLADSGMGKSSLLINYYARHLRSKKKRAFTIGIIPLGIPNVVEQIGRYADPANTVLFLDALDEDTLAIDDHKERLADLLQRSSGFRHVVITCRTQFFLSDEEIPKDAGIARVGITRAGESHNYLLNKLYLSPFSDSQIAAYLKRRFPIWQRNKRKRSRAMIKQMGDLSARPMLLAHVDELLSFNRQFRFSFEIYEELVEAWLTREEKFISKQHLRDFCELAAVDIYSNRERRKAEKITPVELQRIADNIAPEVAHWQERERSFLSNRSLLNRDAEGNRKFSHRSLMEYLVLRRLLRFSEKIAVPRWTDQMVKFHFEMGLRCQLEGDARNGMDGFRFGEGYDKLFRLRVIYPLMTLSDERLRWRFYYSELTNMVWTRVPRSELGWKAGQDMAQEPNERFILRFPDVMEAKLIQAWLAFHHSQFLRSIPLFGTKDCLEEGIDTLRNRIEAYANGLTKTEDLLYLVVENVRVDTEHRVLVPRLTREQVRRIMDH